MDVSVIIVNYRTKELTIQAIQSIYTYTVDINFEIIVVDNHSKDGSLESIKLKFPNVIYIDNEVNNGFGRANNQAAKIAKGKYIFLLNSDAYIQDNALLTFFNYMEKEENNNVAMCGGALYTGQNFETMSYGNFPSVWEAFSSVGFYLLYKNYYMKHIAAGVTNKGNSIKSVDYITGADMFIRKDIFNAIGGFDEDFFMYYEDTEICFRLKKYGYTLSIIPSVEIIHLVSVYREKNKEINYDKVKLIAKSRKMFFKKCYGRMQAELSKLFYSLQIVLLGLIGKDKQPYWKKAWIQLTV